MIHLKIISASNLPSADKNGYSDPYVLVYPVNYGELNLPIAKTKTIKKTLNPKWNENVILPFVSFKTSIRLVFMDADMLSEDDRLGLVDIYPSLSNFYRHDAEVQVANISIDDKYKGSVRQESTVKYSIIPTFTSFDFKQKKDPKRLFVYLDFDSYHPDSQEKISLLVYGVNKNGTIVDPINDVHTYGEIEASHFSPNGLVQVFVFDRTDFWEYGLVDGQYFFIVHSKSFRGKVTLTFVGSPKNISEKKFSSKFKIINNQFSLSLNGENNCLLTFQCSLKFSKKDVKIEPLQVPSNLQVIHLANESEYIPKLNEMMNGIGQLFCPPKKTLHTRFDSVKGKRYSLNELFQINNIRSLPSKINIALGWDTYTDLDLIVFPLSYNDKLLDPVGSKVKKNNSNQSIKSKGDSTRGIKDGDDEVITIDLNNINQNIKCLLIAVSYHQCEDFTFIKGCFLRIVDCNSDKEILFSKLEKGEYKTGVIWLVIGKIEEVWNVYPCFIYVDGSTVKAIQSSLNESIKSGLINQFFNAQ